MKYYIISPIFYLMALIIFNYFGLSAFQILIIVVFMAGCQLLGAFQVISKL